MITTRYNDLYLDLRRELRAADSPNPTLEARELVAFAAGKTKDELQRDGQLYASAEVVERAYDLLRRHLAGEPVAYLIGEWEFYGLPLDITADVLIPRPDTEVLVDAAIQYINTLENPRVLDLCAGSGCIGLAVAAHCPKAQVTLGEKDEGALRICRQNIRRSGLSGRVTPLQMDALVSPSRQLGEFDCILSNPPYITAAEMEELDISVKEYEPHMALYGGEDGLDFYRFISDKWREAMHPGSRLYFEVGAGQDGDVVRMMRQNGFGDIDVLPDLNGIARVVCGTLCDTL